MPENTLDLKKFIISYTVNGIFSLKCEKHTTDVYILLDIHVNSMHF